MPPEDHRKESTLQERLASFMTPRADEAALWTLVNGVGQFVLTGWCLAFASFALLIGFSQIGGGGGLPAWLNGLFAVFFIGIGAILLYLGVRLLAQSMRCFWVTWRKAWFIFRYYRRPDTTRALQSAEGDPVLGPYIRHLLKHGRLDLTDDRSAEA